MLFPSIRTIVERYGLLPDKKHSKRYGQNFLFDDAITQRIATFARIFKDSYVMEIGPGPGGLTRAILNCQPKSCVAIEYDPLCVRALSYLDDVYSNLIVVQADALSIKLSDIRVRYDWSSPMHIVSNLPYNIGTELLVRWLHQLDDIASMTLMFQKEVAHRIIASPGSGTYGRLSVLVQNLCHVEHGFDLPASAFTPAPKVESSVIHIRPKSSYADVEPFLSALEVVTHAAFHQRRKQIKSPLKALFSDQTEHVLNQVGLSGMERAENITPDQYLALAHYWSTIKSE